MQPITINNSYTVAGTTPELASAFQNDAGALSTLAVNLVRRADGTREYNVFPGGPRVGYKIIGRRDSLDKKTTVFDVEYSGAFVGHGTLTMRQNPDGTVSIHDRWNNVRNNSGVPTPLIDTLHGPAVVGTFAQLAGTTGPRAGNLPLAGVGRAAGAVSQLANLPLRAAGLTGRAGDLARPTTVVRPAGAAAVTAAGAASRSATRVAQTGARAALGLFGRLLR